ncbi:MAG: 1-acyl-sn-glycerol-3-phosphate acyltransferase [Clostridia bacterium]|nr:1-acyl-sn-glycerol-3-phosphate acyltransferase [Clostridia bacterium]
MKKKARSDKFYRKTFLFFRPLFCLVAKMKLGVKAKQPKKFDEPILIYSNHTTDLDFLAVSAHIKNHFYLVCSRHILAMGLTGWLIEKLFHPVAVFKGSVKGGEMLDLLRRIKRGNNVLVFCEGRLSHNGRTQPIGIAAAQLAKAAKCRLVTFRTDGGFFKQPRWQKGMNPGKLFDSGIVNEYSKEELAALSDAELLEKIEKDLYTDAYEEQKKRMQKLKFPHGVGEILNYYSLCPACHDESLVCKDGFTLACKNCGYEMRWNEYGFFESEKPIVKTTAEWEALEQKAYSSRFSEGKFLADDGVSLFATDEAFQKTPLGTGTLASSAEGLSFGERSFPFSEMEGLEVLAGGASLVFSSKGEHFLLTTDGGNLAKYLYLYEWGKKQSTKES